MFTYLFLNARATLSVENTLITDSRFFDLAPVPQETENCSFNISPVNHFQKNDCDALYAVLKTLGQTWGTETVEQVVQGSVQKKSRQNAF